MSGLSSQPLSGYGMQGHRRAQAISQRIGALANG